MYESQIQVIATELQDSVAALERKDAVIKALEEQAPENQIRDAPTEVSQRLQKECDEAFITMEKMEKEWKVILCRAQEAQDAASKGRDAAARELEDLRKEWICQAEVEKQKYEDNLRAAQEEVENTSAQLDDIARDFSKMADKYDEALRTQKTLEKDRDDAIASAKSMESERDAVAKNHDQVLQSLDDLRKKKWEASEAMAQEHVEAVQALEVANEMQKHTVHVLETERNEALAALESRNAEADGLKRIAEESNKAVEQARRDKENVLQALKEKEREMTRDREAFLRRETSAKEDTRTLEKMQETAVRDLKILQEQGHRTAKEMAQNNAAAQRELRELNTRLCEAKKDHEASVQHLKEKEMELEKAHQALHVQEKIVAELRTSSKREIETMKAQLEVRSPSILTISTLMHIH